MSGFLGKIITHFPFARYHEDSLQQPDYRYIYTGSPLETINPIFLWPRSSFTGQNYTSIPVVWECTHQNWEYDSLVAPSGIHVRKKISGVVRDQFGNPQAGVTVQLFNTSNGMLVDTVTTDTSGNYYGSDPNNVNCFAVAYEIGSPDMSGTTLNILVGT